MKKKTIKLTDSALMGIINEAVDEFRGDDIINSPDGDRHYIMPDGRTNYRSFSDDSKMGKRALGNSYINLTGKMYKTYGPSEVSHGKGDLCYQVNRFINEKFQLGSDWKPNGKIEWTEKELELIKKIKSSLHDLARLSKEEGNKKRGYDGPEEPKELNEAFGHTTEEEKLEAMRQWKEENLADDLDWEVCGRIDYYDTCLAGTVTSDEGWEFTAYGSGDERGEFVSFDDNAPEIEFKMPDGREGYFYPNDTKVTMSESQLRNHIYEKVKKNLNINESLKGFFQTLASESNPEQGQVTGDQLGRIIGKMDKYTKAELRKMLLNGYKVFVNPGGSARNQYGMKFLYKVVDTQGNVVSYITPAEEGEYKGMLGLVRAN